jgi:hypothetical protein
MSRSSHRAPQQVNEACVLEQDSDLADGPDRLAPGEEHDIPWREPLDVPVLVPGRAREPGRAAGVQRIERVELVGQQRLRERRPDELDVVVHRVVPVSAGGRTTGRMDDNQWHARLLGCWFGDAFPRRRGCDEDGARQLEQHCLDERAAIPESVRVDVDLAGLEKPIKPSWTC